MPIGTGVPGEDFSARVIMRAPGIIDQFWACTHEFSSNGGGTIDSAFEAFATSLAQFHSGCLRESFFVERVVISTLARDSSPYDVTKLAVYEFGLAGALTASSDVLPLWNVVLVKRLVPNGRLGNMLLRGMLSETDVSSPGGVPQLTSKENIQTVIDNSIASSTLGDYIGSEATNLQLYMITPGELNNIERPVMGFQVSRLTYKKLNNKYFDKGIL